MEITPDELRYEYLRAIVAWPFVWQVEREYGLPPCILWAVGSRETNLHNELGDSGHGHGVWQLDNRSHTIPAGFLSNVPQQATTAANMLAHGISHYETQFKLSHDDSVRAALAAYNCGQGTVDYNLAHGRNVDDGTAGGNYSADTYARLLLIQSWEGMTMARTISDDDVAAIAKAVWQYTIAPGGFSDAKTHYTGTYQVQAKDIQSVVHAIAKKVNA